MEMSQDNNKEANVIHEEMKSKTGSTDEVLNIQSWSVILNNGVITDNYS